MKDCNCYVQPHYTATASVKHHTEHRNAMCNVSKEIWDIDAFLSESVEGNLWQRWVYDTSLVSHRGCPDIF